MAQKRKTKKKITLSEFKLWLTGVQSMQKEDWHPNKEQWTMILDQIEMIKEAPPPIQQTTPEPSPPPQPAPLVPRRDLPPIQRSPSGELMPPSLIPPPPPVDIDQLQANSQPTLQGFNDSDSGIRAPSIPADGEYSSSFS